MPSPDNNGVRSLAGTEYELNVITDHVKGPEGEVWVRFILTIGPLSTSIALPPNYMDAFIDGLAPALKEAAIEARKSKLVG